MSLEGSNSLIKSTASSLNFYGTVFDLNKVTFRNCLARYDWNVDIYLKKRHDRRKTWLDSVIESSNGMRCCALLYLHVCLRYIFLQTHKLKMRHLKNIMPCLQEVWQAVLEVNWDPVHTDNKKFRSVKCTVAYCSRARARYHWCLAELWKKFD